MSLSRRPRAQPRRTIAQKLQLLEFTLHVAQMLVITRVRHRTGHLGENVTTLGGMEGSAPSLPRADGSPLPINHQPSTINPRPPVPLSLHSAQTLLECWSSSLARHRQCDALQGKKRADISERMSLPGGHGGKRTVASKSRRLASPAHQRSTINHQPFPIAFFSAAALSVASHVRSLSSLPK